MDPETLKVLIALGEHGGSVAMLIGVFIAGRASKVAAEAVENLKAIRSSLDANFKAQADVAARINDKLDAVNRDIQTLPLRMIRTAR